MAEPIDPRALRDAAGQFATGVTVVTTLDRRGTPVGLTANSFTSVSLEPPMVLFCLEKTSETLTAFESGGGFAVHVLGAGQLELSIRFASRGIDRFEGLHWTPGIGGVPVLDGALAVFECSTTHAYEGGDHVIFVGTVERLGPVDDSGPALGYFRGGYIETAG